MDFQHGVKFDLTIATGDTFAAATVSSLLNAAVLYRKMSGSDAEKAALAATDISSSAGQLDSSLRDHRHGVRQPAQVVALPKHGKVAALNSDPCGLVDLSDVAHVAQSFFTRRLRLQSVLHAV